MSILLIFCYLFFYFTSRVLSVPPAACFANFKSEDCGRPAEPVMYYYKPGSRCEVGLWRGCLPNINMFKDEYECVTTCIFSRRVMPEDYHNFNELDFSEAYGDFDITTELFNETVTFNITEQEQYSTSVPDQPSTDNSTAVTISGAPLTGQTGVGADVTGGTTGDGTPVGGASDNTAAITTDVPLDR